jgi:CDP-diacylglycerol pyrophosphatase
MDMRTTLETGAVVADIRPVALAIGLALLAAACTAPAGADLPPPPLPHANGQALWHVVHDHCVPDQQQGGRPAPCIEVSIAQGVERGYAVLKDQHGAEQYLVMPTMEITGIEDARLLAPDAANYFADAWRARAYVEALIGKPTPRQDMAVSVNSPYGRSQDLLHLHVDCLTPQSVAALAAALPHLERQWSHVPLTLENHPYYAMRLEGDAPANPFRLLAGGMPGAAKDMAAWTLVLAGATYPDGKPGFVLLAGRADPAHGDFASGEELQDHACAVMHGGRGPAQHSTTFTARPPSEVSL